MVQLVFYLFFDVTEVDDHAIGIQFFRATVNSDDPVVTVQVLTFAGIGETQAMCCGDLHPFNYSVHA